MAGGVPLSASTAAVMSTTTSLANATSGALPPTVMSWSSCTAWPLLASSVTAMMMSEATAREVENSHETPPRRRACASLVLASVTCERCTPADLATAAITPACAASEKVATVRPSNLKGVESFVVVIVVLASTGAAVGFAASVGAAVPSLHSQHRLLPWFCPAALRLRVPRAPGRLLDPCGTRADQSCRNRRAKWIQ